MPSISAVNINPQAVLASLFALLIEPDFAVVAMSWTCHHKLPVMYEDKSISVWSSRDDESI